MNENFLSEYAKIIVKIGANVQPGEEVFINCPVIAADLAREIASEAYAAGAKKITCSYKDEQMSRLRLLHEEHDVVVVPDRWQIEQKNYIVKHKCAYINILAEDPDIFEGVNTKTLSDMGRISAEKYKKFYDATMSNNVKWCLAAYAFPAWAKKMFPDLPEKEAVDKLWDYIAKTMRMDDGNAIENWSAFQNKTEKICDYLNRMQFDSFVYKSANGTDLTVGMPENYRFNGGSEPTPDGVKFVANMPTEECFSAPHREKVNGIVYSSLPLVDNGKTVKDFYIRFENGKAVEYDAKEGAETLKEIINSDDTACYLGEIAFVEYDSPIRKLNTVFYNTLFDENASCHLALGRGYPECIEGGTKMSVSKLKKQGINYSTQHCDFMIGTRDMTITGIKNGKEYPVFVNGNFAEGIKNS